MEGARPAETQAVIHRLALGPDSEAILAGMSKGKRRDVRASQRKDLTIRRAEREQDLTETYFRLHVATRRRLGVPPSPKRFFRLFWQAHRRAGPWVRARRRAGGDPRGERVFLTGNGTVVYKYSASDANRRGTMPNDLLIWTAIREAGEQGFTSFDFGRTELHSTGLREFKSRWGAVEEPLVYSSIGEPAADELPATPGLLGKVLRRSPVWVTRATGELFYRYAA